MITVWEWPDKPHLSFSRARVLYGMAEAATRDTVEEHTLGECSGNVPVVLRVKRKRTEDPAEALSMKKLK